MIKDRICQYCVHYHNVFMCGSGDCRGLGSMHLKHVDWCDTCADFERKVTIHKPPKSVYRN